MTFNTQGSYSASGTAADKAGNAASAGIPVNIAQTAPTITGSAAPGPNANGWTNGPVTVSFTCADIGGSGIVACPSPTTLSLDGAGQSVTGTATDAAGNSASTTVGNINIDKTPPTIALSSRTPAANANGWNNGPVTVTWSCADSLSGPTAASVSATVSSEGANQSATGTCTDKAGNTASNTQTGISIDLTPPSLAPSVSPNPVLLNGSATASPNATDALSGVATQSCASVDTSSVGTQTVSCNAADKAGNTASKTASYVVAYGQKLLYNTTTLYKSGTTIPIALQLQDAAGKNVSSASITVTAVSVVNSSGTVVRTINAPFTFSKSQAYYTHSLNTTGLTTGRYNLRFTAGSDPTTHLAPFSIK
jgi:hypothetical protein